MHNILFISRAYGESAGGMERLSFELISEFEKKNNFAVTKIVNKTKRHASLLSTRLSSIIFAITVLPQAIKASKNADIVHIGDPVLSVVGWSIARFRKIPVAVTVHGLDVAYANVFYRLYLKLFFHSFTAYIPISEYAKQLLEKHRVRGTITVISPGIRDDFYDASQTKQDLSKLLNRDISQKTVLVTTGRLVARKGHAWFISTVFSKLPQNFIYVIAGDGAARESIAGVIASLGLQKRVFMLGRISHEDQKTLLNTCDAFIQPNIAVAGDAEGFGIAPLEAALCGKTVFAANIDGIPSAIHDGKNGTLLKSGNADAWINALAQFTPKETQARQYTLATFGWDTIIKKYEQVFSE
ncbi:MAG TPA: glycosyltransferase family 4 protein [Candidatus Andersenbacteria bacterium]|nr:glycosyltransferase family 4 protein [Candidatus Andersenbacteria bacterium]